MTASAAPATNTISVGDVRLCITNWGAATVGAGTGGDPGACPGAGGVTGGAAGGALVSAAPH